jgi:hypothetical protein
VVVDGAGRPVAPGWRSPGNLPEQKSEDESEKLTGHPEKLGESTLHKLVGFIIQYGEGMTFLSGKVIIALTSEGRCLRLPETAHFGTTARDLRARLLAARWVIPARRKRRPSGVLAISLCRSALLFLGGIRYHPRHYGGAVSGYAAHIAASIAERG